MRWLVGIVLCLTCQRMVILSILCEIVKYNKLKSNIML